MTELTYDVAVVGAGPAGSVAALKLSEKGFKVIVFDKRQEIGAPKRCAEGLSLGHLERMGIKPNPKWAPQGIKGTILYTPSMRTVELSFPNNMGYVLERKVFEKHLAAMAINAGAKYMVKTHVTDVIKDGKKVIGVKANHMGDEIVVHCKVVVAADGVDSMTAKRAGIDTVNKLGDYHSGFQYEMAGVKCDEEKLHLFFGNKKSPKGYLWIFPKGETIANVGIGIMSSKSEDNARAKDLLDNFIENNPAFFKNASMIEINGGGIPVSATTTTFVGDGIVVVGDAAQQVNPIHGGGIGISMSAATLAAEVISSAITEGDISEKRLFEYEKKWREADGAKMQRLMKLRHFMEKLEDKEIEKLADILTGDDVLKLIVDSDLKILLKALMKNAPTMLLLAKKYME